MNIRHSNWRKYYEAFGDVPPQLYMRHLSDDAYNTRIVKALKENVPINPEEFMPPMTHHDDGTPKVFI